MSHTLCYRRTRWCASKFSCRGRELRQTQVRNGRRRSLSSCLESVGCGFGGEVDSDDGAGCCGVWAASESFGVGVVVGLLSLVSLLPAVYPCPAVDVCGSEQGDAAVAVL